MIVNSLTSYFDPNWRLLWAIPIAQVYVYVWPFYGQVLGFTCRWIDTFMEILTLRIMTPLV